MLVTLPMITKKIMLASAALVAVGGYAASQIITPADAQPDPQIDAGLEPVAGSDPLNRPTTKVLADNALPIGPKLTPAIRQAADLLLDDDAHGDTRALIVMKNGKLVYERYAEDFGAQTKLISWSMAKSITAVLIGFLVSDGRLSLDSPAPVPAWQRSGDPRGEITLRDLLHMASGLEHREGGDPLWEADTTNMLFGSGVGDMAGFAEAKPAVAKAGEVFNYSTATSVILADILADTLTPSKNPAARRDAVLEFMRGRLIEPLSMSSLTPEFDARGTMIAGSIMHATARDYARFGEFLRNGGMADGQRLLPKTWIQFMLSPSAADKGYGGHIWLNRHRPAGTRPALWPQRGPNDLFAAIGHQGQYIIVSPSQRVTVVRLGVTEDEEFPLLRRRLANLVESL
jgi:CubicO group peptidase (beta-lactamase class C family)